jgi:hypothetical protein
MDNTMIGKGLALVRQVLPRVVWAHPFVSAFLVAVLVGGGLRFVPASTAAVPGSSTTGGSTACQVK